MKRRIGKYINKIHFFVYKVECIISALPEATERDIKAVGNGFGSALLNQPVKDHNGRNPNPKLDELLTDAPSDAKHLIKSLLVLDPTRRLTAKEALDHRYIEKFVNLTNLYLIWHELFD